MAFPGDALNATRRNTGPLLIYFLVYLGVRYVQLSLGDWAFNSDLETLGEVSPGVRLLLFVQDLALCVIFALTHCVVFSRLGKDIDKPLWKITDREAIRRFFSLWFIVNLGVTLLVSLQVSAAIRGDESTSSLWFVLVLCSNVFAVPVGALIMFYGGLGREGVFRAFSTGLMQFPRMILIFFFAWILLVIVIFVAMDESIGDYIKPFFSIVEAFGDGFVFSCTWIVCIYQRREEEDESDFDF